MKKHDSIYNQDRSLSMRLCARYVTMAIVFCITLVELVVLVEFN